MLRWFGGDVALASARISSIVLTAASSAIVARSLGPQGYGVFAAGASVAALMVLGKGYGADSLYLRGNIDERTLQRRSFYAGIANLVLVLVAALAWPGLTWAARGCTVLMGSAFSLTVIRTPWLAIPSRQMNFGSRARRELLGAALSLGGVMLLAAWLQRPVLASLGLLLGTGVTTLVSLPSLERERSNGVQPSGDGSIRAGLSFTAIEGLFVAYFTLDGAMIAAMRPAIDAGTYRVAYAFVIAAAVVPIALNGDVLRVRLWQLDGEGRRNALRRALLLTGVSGVIVTLAFELLGGVGERAFFGAAFATAVPIIRLLGAAMPFHYANSLMSNILTGAGRVPTVIRVQSAMLVVNVAGNFALIPSHGPKGAALVTAITEAVGTLIYVVILKSSAKLRVLTAR